MTRMESALNTLAEVAQSPDFPLNVYCDEIGVTHER